MKIQIGSSSGNNLTEGLFEQTAISVQQGKFQCTAQCVAVTPATVTRSLENFKVLASMDDILPGPAVPGKLPDDVGQFQLLQGT